MDTHNDNNNITKTTSTCVGISVACLCVLFECHQFICKSIHPSIRPTQRPKKNPPRRQPNPNPDQESINIVTINWRWTERRGRVQRVNQKERPLGTDGDSLNYYYYHILCPPQSKPNPLDFIEFLSFLKSILLFFRCPVVPLSTSSCVIS